MPNRIIHESALTSRTLARMSAGAERLFWRLTVAVDDFGRTIAEAGILRAKCFPGMLDRVTDDDVRGWLEELATDNPDDPDDLAALVLYRAKGRLHLEISEWRNRQRVRSPKSKFPDPPQPAASGGTMPPPQPAATCGESPQLASVNGNVNENVNENESENDAPAAPRAPASGHSPLPMPCPPDLEVTAAMLEKLRAVGCADPPAEVRLYIAASVSGGKRHVDWTANGPPFSSWVARHGQMGCAGGRGGGQRAAPTDATRATYDTGIYDPAQEIPA